MQPNTKIEYNFPKSFCIENYFTMKTNQANKIHIPNFQPYFTISRKYKNKRYNIFTILFTVNYK